ncbi:hypothetical protein B0H15DRAFT_24610 [Mycena belliarum]|uniref:Uncharacterized protein n=1 Tax=Mycena belliarum TaxID=1033014 RepID=A0AAD6XYH1_9AGAR|nr:hypothetical protein B0H15DRAFT_24610 [Mycena belliae]
MLTCVCFQLSIEPPFPPGPDRQDKGREVSRPSPSQRSTRPTRELPRSSLVEHTGRFSAIPGLRPRVAERHPRNGSLRTDHRCRAFPESSACVPARARLRRRLCRILARCATRASRARRAARSFPRLESKRAVLGPMRRRCPLCLPTPSGSSRALTREGARVPILPTPRLDGRGAVSRGMARKRSGVGQELPASLSSRGLGARGGWGGGAPWADGGGCG